MVWLIVEYSTFHNENVVIVLSKILVFPYNHPVDSDHLLSNPICSSSPNITTKKVKQLRIMTISFQGVWGKKEELELGLFENKGKF